MHVRLLTAAAALLSASLAAHANTLNFTFTYASTSGDVAGESATGNGSFSVTYTPGSGTGTLSAFSFTDTIDSSEGNSTFTYSGLSSVASSSINLTTGASPTIASAQITTDYLTGTNSAFGPVDFVLQASGVTAESTSASNPAATDFLAGITTGGGTITAVSATPEPSSLLLLGAGLLAVAGVGLRKRFA